MVNLNTIQSLLMPWDSGNYCIGVAESLAKNLGWYPSDIVANKKSNSIATGHLFVEHGLDNPAVISFIDNRRANELSDFKCKAGILGISYNNLIDYHIIIGNDVIEAYHNRALLDRNIIYNQKLENYEEALDSDYFCKYIEKQPIRANLPSLDDELIGTISRWKRLLYAELKGNISNEEISNFFNAIIFTRAFEDSQSTERADRILLKCLWGDENNFSDILSLSFKKLGIQSYPDQVINENLFDNINKLDKGILNNIFIEFYQSNNIPYKYDFSIISKHALSRIYERYVSILSVKETESIQLNIFGNIPNPTEEINKSSGSYYTPQFIARFFSRYIKKINPDFSQGNFSVLEPAVGSGIFLRTILEDLTNKKLETAFSNITGIDKNKTACDASKLSLTLLHLVATGKLPQNKINIITEDSLDYFSKNKKRTYDIIISNPPFISYGAMSDEDRSKVKSFLSKYSYNKYDLYLSFVKIAIDSLNENGLGLFVLPNTFLVTDSAKLIRKYLIEECNILCLVDLSSVKYDIFENVGIYPILLIFQKRKKNDKQNINAVITTINDYVGRALTDILEDKKTLNPSYNIFPVSQDFFHREKWTLLTPAESNLEIRMSKLKKIEDFFDIRTGFTSGLIEAFIIPPNKIPRNENEIYIPYLRDREMGKYSIIEDSKEYIFYPYLEDGTKINEKKLMQQFPNTYRRLYQSYNSLSQRSEVIKEKMEWYMPNRPRKRDFMLIPKIITPHLVFTPRFSLDIKGKYAISRCPFLVLKKDSEQGFAKHDLIFYILGMLNSSVCTWYLLNHTSRYQNGFMMIEPASLKEIPVVDPIYLSKISFLKFVALVKERFLYQEDDSNFSKVIEIEKEIDRISMDFYGLNKGERNVIFGNYGDTN
jgi:methylase of polypeptide subunit release factors